mmetsp:Transcript_21708/g.74624  ORF Transcript_21708/g.74624 Transcript_21708/m.74624 type:complete len:328 (-) Transcript_21708:271-1254(-)
MDQWGTATRALTQSHRCGGRHEVPHLVALHLDLPHGRVLVEAVGGAHTVDGHDGQPGLGGVRKGRRRRETAPEPPDSGVLGLERHARLLLLILLVHENEHVLRAPVLVEILREGCLAGATIGVCTKANFQGAPEPLRVAEPELLQLEISKLLQQRLLGPLIRLPTNVLDGTSDNDGVALIENLGERLAHPVQELSPDTGRSIVWQFRHPLLAEVTPPGKNLRVAHGGKVAHAGVGAHLQAAHGPGLVLPLQCLAQEGGGVGAVVGPVEELEVVVIVGRPRQGLLVGLPITLAVALSSSATSASSASAAAAGTGSDSGADATLPMDLA